MKDLIENKNLRFSKRLYEIRKKMSIQNCSFQEFTSEHILIRHVVFVLIIVKHVINDEKFYFSPNICEIQKKF